MIAGLKIDTRKLRRDLKKVDLSTDDLLQIEGAGQYMLINGMRLRVPVDTSATRNSIMPHIIFKGKTKIVDEVGPETLYAIFLEYGTGIFAENGQGRQTGWVYFDGRAFHFTRGMKAQPFIRPTVKEDAPQVLSAMVAAFNATLEERWPK